jgi:hypothetical protein
MHDHTLTKHTPANKPPCSGNLSSITRFAFDIQIHDLHHIDTVTRIAHQTRTMSHGATGKFLPGLMRAYLAGISAQFTACNARLF